MSSFFSFLFKKNKAATMAFIRLILYSLVIVMFAEFIRFDALLTLRDRKFDEHSLTEFAQSVILLLLAGIYFYST